MSHILSHGWCFLSRFSANLDRNTICTIEIVIELCTKDEYSLFESRLRVQDEYSLFGSRLRTDELCKWRLAKLCVFGVSGAGFGHGLFSNQLDNKVFRISKTSFCVVVLCCLGVQHERDGLFLQICSVKN